MKPEGYPLPWCEQYDIPYWRINAFWNASKEGWSKFQAKKEMKEIIPVIDWILEGYQPVRRNGDKMARANKVWVVLNEYKQPIACFTVKHECKTWLENQKTNQKIGYLVAKFQDGIFNEKIDLWESEEFLKNG